MSPTAFLRRAALAIVLFAFPASAQVMVGGQFVTSGLTQPTFITHAPGDATRMFITEKAGRIKILQGTSILPTPFLDIASSVSSSQLEFGLLGLCFDPDYTTNGFFYVNYIELGTGNSIIARFTVTANPNVADPASRFPILKLIQPSGNHRAGWLDFGADGYLYVPFGDGGPENDPNNHAQDPAILQGKIVRIDVTGDDFPADANNNYRIPPTNPFVGQPGFAPEIFALGLRNPFRCSFDRLTHDLYIGDVGQGAREEISFLGAGTSGQNFGWRCTEGNFCPGNTGCTCMAPTLTPPIHDYTHSLGASVTGGHVYRGTAIAGLQGTYFFGDWGSSRVWSFRYSGGVVSEYTDRTAQLAPPTGQTINFVVSFGEDLNGELYVLDYGGGEVFKIVSVADTILPQITITSPSSAPVFDTTATSVTLGGTASDAVGVTLVTWTSLAGGSGTASGTTSWTVPGLALAPGDNSFTVTARDAAGNTRSDTIVVRCFPPATSFCAGDGTLVACPCGNSGTDGRGCANSLFASGALLTGGGTASLSGDSAALYASEISGSVAIFVQGATVQAPALVDDGIFCVGNPIVRIGNMPVGGNASVYPDTIQPEISFRGMIGAPGDYTYQVFYRNAAATFCPPATSNRTNGVILHWVP